MDARVMEGVIGDAEARLGAVRDWGQGQSAKATGLDAVVTHQREQIKRLETGLKTIVEYTGDTRHPNGVWDAHVIAGRLLRGEDQNGRMPQSDGGSEHA